MRLTILRSRRRPASPFSCPGIRTSASFYPGVGWRGGLPAVCVWLKPDREDAGFHFERSQNLGTAAAVGLESRNRNASVRVRERARNPWSSRIMSLWGIRMNRFEKPEPQCAGGKFFCPDDGKLDLMAAGTKPSAALSRSRLLGDRH
jgi:hypothetical protein